MRDMIHQRIGIDTSVLVRLVTGLPPEAYSYCVEQLNALTSSGAEIVVSNQVIGETYVTVQHHYGATGKDAQAEIRNVFRSGLVAPLNGRAVIEALNASGGPGLFDRLITNDYSRAGLETLTLDQQMASLPDARLLQGTADASLD